MKSIKHNVQGEFHSTDCSIIILSVAIWSVHDLSGLKPAWFCLSFLSMHVLILARIILVRTLLVIANSVIPRQFPQFPRSPSYGAFFGSFTRCPVFHSVGIASFSQMMLNTWLSYKVLWCLSSLLLSLLVLPHIFSRLSWYFFWSFFLLLISFPLWFFGNTGVSFLFLHSRTFYSRAAIFFSLKLWKTTFSG